MRKARESSCPLWCGAIVAAPKYGVSPSSLTKLADLPYLHLQVILVPLHLQELLTRQFCPASATRIAPMYIYIQTRGNTHAMIIIHVQQAVALKNNFLTNLARFFSFLLV